jgi:beta-1,4-mannosyl-glycoprotein beta-1,4-N-acetylglucosaminyltransferase
MYNGEEDILALRFNVLNDIVDYFVIVESTKTFSGLNKGLSLNLDNYSEFKDKIIHIVVDNSPRIINSERDIEEYQRNSIIKGLVNAKPMDRVIISDVDEIPNPDSIKKYSSFFIEGTFNQKLYYYFYNNRAYKIDKNNTSVPIIWNKARITCYKYLIKYFKTPHNLRSGPKTLGSKYHKLIWTLRKKVFKDGGWHFSWIMKSRDIYEKICSSAHQGYVNESILTYEHINDCIDKKVDIYGRKRIIFKVENIDKNFLRYTDKSLLSEHFIAQHDS